MTRAVKTNYIVVTSAAATQIDGRHIPAGAVDLIVDTTAITDLKTLEIELGRALGIPYPFHGLAAVISLGVDIDEWYPSTNGYVLRVDRLDALGDDVAKALVGILPNMIDRFRSTGEPFVAVLSVRAHRDLVLQTLAHENDELDRFGTLPNSAPTWAVPVLELD